MNHKTWQRGVTIEKNADFIVGEALASILGHRYFEHCLSWLKPLPLSDWQSLKYFVFAGIIILHFMLSQPAR